MSTESEHYSTIVVEQHPTTIMQAYNRIDLAECPDCGEHAFQYNGRCGACHNCGWSLCSR
jgi:hypothetical protein